MSKMRRVGLGIFVLILGYFSTNSFSSTIPDPLERFALADLRVMGTVMHSDAYRQAVALVLDPDGYVHSAILGSYMGKNKGVLVKIEKTRIVVSEVFFSEVDKDWHERFIVIPVETIGKYPEGKEDPED
jgi:Tfp pilus assembly protein PilP